MTAVGEMPEIIKGEQIELAGHYMIHPTYGVQFRVLHCDRVLPSGVPALYKYLASGAIKGVGPKTAKSIIGQFGGQTAEVLECHPEKLSLIKGISFERAKEIAKEFGGKKSIRELMISLAVYGITPDEAVEIYRSEGAEATEKIRQNPYILCSDSVRFDFERVEKIAEKLNFPKDSNDRICAGMMHVLEHNLFNGHTCIPREKVVLLTSKMLDCNLVTADDCCEILISEFRVVSRTFEEREYLFIREYFNYENFISEKISAMQSCEAIYNPVTVEEINVIEKRLNINFDEIQKAAVERSVSEHLLIITGGPGTGKTTTVNGIIQIMENRGLKIALAAPTGRAAQRMTELSGKEAKTIHRLLEVGTAEDGKSHIYVRNEKNPLDVDVVIVDEMSMVDVSLFANLLKAVRLGCRLIMVGDSDQLPSVGAGNVH